MANVDEAPKTLSFSCFSSAVEHGRRVSVWSLPMQPTVAPPWDHIDVFGGMSEEEYAKFPEAYRREVAELRRMAEARDRIHSEQGRVSEEEMDASGARENELQLPPLVLLRLHSIVAHFETDLAMLLADDAALVDHAADVLAQHGPHPRRHRFAAEHLVEHCLRSASAALSVVLDETLLNALKHGIHGDMRRRVYARRRTTPTECVTQVQDEGLGYDASELPDPLVMLGSGHGRGLLITDELSSHVERAERGTLVTITLTRQTFRKRVFESIGRYLDASEHKPELIAERLAALESRLYGQEPAAPATHDEQRT